jgi:hypothetical protein
MSKNSKALIGMASLAAIGVLMYWRYNRKKVKKEMERLERVAEEGYEFAQDILFPLKRHPLKRFF